MNLGCCKKCGRDLINSCPVCGKPVETYSRPCGYLRPISTWNDGKQQEFRDRREYECDHVVNTNSSEPHEQK